MNRTNDQARAAMMNLKDFMKTSYGPTVYEFLMTDHPARAMFDEGALRVWHTQLMTQGRVYPTAARDIMAAIDTFIDEVEA